MSATQDPSSAGSRRQKRMGPAPFASFEDLSDELESPEDRNAAGSVVRLPGIREDITPSSPAVTKTEFTYAGISLVGAAVSPPPGSAVSSLSTPQSSTKMSLQTPSTPRIDISRASSSSHHDSKDSTPDRELFEGHDPASAKLGLGFREDGTLDLRSSTEELDFQDQTEKKKGKTRPQSPCLHDDSYYNHQRKDSQSSEIGLLSISGRTSRISSIGSQGSNQSRLSNASHLSVLSGQSGLSRSPSPHKMLLETSFCGYKPPNTSRAIIEQSGTKVESEDLEKVLLSRKHDPTEAILAEGVSITPRRDSGGSFRLPPEKPVRKIERRVQSVKSDITIRVDKPPPTTDSNNTPKLPRKIISKSGVEYIYIPLKGPLPKDHDNETSSQKTANALKPKVRITKAVTEKKDLCSKSKQTTNGKQASGSSKPLATKVKSKADSSSIHSDKKGPEPKYIRIKLKPDYMYSDEDHKVPEVQKPESLDLEDISKKDSQFRTEIALHEEIKSEPVSVSVSTTTTVSDQGKSLSSTPSASPKLSRHNIIKESNKGSKTPSPSLSRKSSFASLFRSKEAIISPESPTLPSTRRKSNIRGALREVGDSIRERSRSRSKSRERDKTSNLSTAPSSTESIDSKSKQKSVFSLFKSKKPDKTKSDVDSSSPELLSSIEGLGKVEFKFTDTSQKDVKRYRETQLECESIRIPLHSPTHYEERSILQELKTSSQDSQETVIEAVTRNVDVVVEAIPQNIQTNAVVQKSKGDFQNRQSSTSSENVTFSTKLGSDNEIFTTKLPKKKLVRSKHSESEPETIATNGIEEEDKVELKEETLQPLSEVQKHKEENLEAKIESTKIADSTGYTEKPINFEIKLDRELPTSILGSNRSSIMSSQQDEDRNSSESERDSEIEFPRTKKDLDLKLELDFAEPERKTLVLQDSFEDELPYVPTTLPQERSAAVPIIPVKQRSTFEMKTCPIERPRSTTPINPSCLEEYCEEVMGNFNTDAVTKQIEKLKISLPRHDSVETKVKSPRKSSTTTNWSEFAEKGISSVRRSSLTQEDVTPPPLPPKGIQKEWINFEEIPEKRKPPKRIQTIPSRGHIDVPDSVLQENVVYNYVNPEECKCECHELSARERERKVDVIGKSVQVQEDELPLLEDDPGEEDKSGAEPVEKLKLDIAISDRRSVVSDSSVDLSMSVEQSVQPEINGVGSLRTPFTSDLGLSSNRSSIVSQDEPQSPDSDSPNAFPKVS